MYDSRVAGPIVIERQDTILTITVFRDYNDREHEDHLAELSAVMERGKVGQVHRWVVVNDLKVPMSPNATHRRRQADWMKAHDAELRYRTACIGFVMSSAIMRGGLTAIFWLAPLPCPHGIFATMPEAMVWAREHARLPVHPSLLPATLRSANGS